MKKIVRLTESDLIHLVKRVLKEQAQTTNDLKATLLQKVGFGRGVDYKDICDFCTKWCDSMGTKCLPNNPRAKKAAEEFDAAITGGENPFSNFGGTSNPNQNSSAYKAGMAIQNNCQSAEDICNMIKYYSTYAGNGEDFADAIGGELMFKFDSSSNLELMFGKPIYNIVKDY